MKRNNIKLLFIGLILIFFGCGDKGKNQQTHSLGESKYSAWLSYQRTELGVKLYIKDPDHKMPTQVVWCTSTPQKIKATNSNTIVLNVDNLKVATNAATHVGMMVTLNARDCIGAVSLGKYLFDSKVKDRFADGLIMEIGSSSIPFEQLIKNKIKLWVSAGMEPLDQAKKERFNALGIHWIPNYDWREEHPLGKAE